MQQQLRDEEMEQAAAAAATQKKAAAAHAAAEAAEAAAQAAAAQAAGAQQDREQQLQQQFVRPPGLARGAAGEVLATGLATWQAVCAHGMRHNMPDILDVCCRWVFSWVQWGHQWQHLWCKAFRTDPVTQSLCLLFVCVNTAMGHTPASA